MIRTLVAIAALQAVGIVCSMTRAKLVSLGLGPHGLGILGTVDQLLLSVQQISVLSLPTVALKFLSRAHSESSEAFRRTYASFLTPLVGLSLVGAVATITIVSIWPDVLGAELAAERAAVVIALGTVPTLALGQLVSNVLASSQRPLGAAAVQAGLALIAAAAAGIGLALGGIREIYLTGLVLSLMVLGSLLLYLRSRLHLPFFDPHTSIRRELERSPDIATSMFMAYVSLSVYSVSLLAPRYAVLQSSGAETAGLLQSVLSLVAAVGALLAAMNAQYLMPVLNRRSSPAEKLEAASQFQRRQILLMAVAAAPLVFFPEPALTILFSERFVSAAAWLPIFLCWQLLVLQAGVFQQLLFSTENLKPIATVTCAGYLAAAIMCFVLAPVFGVMGVAFALCAGALIVIALCMFVLRRLYGLVVRTRALGLTAYVIAGALIGGWLALQSGVGATGWAVRGLLCAGYVAGLTAFLNSSEMAEIMGGAARAFRLATAGARPR